MIDKTLARMIDEFLLDAENDGFCRRKMLEIPVNQAHLQGLPICVQTRFNVRDFVRDLFTIHRFVAFRQAATSDLFDQSRSRRWRSAWSRRPNAPAPMRPMRSRCAASRRASRCATAASRNPSAPRATMSACACWSGQRQAVVSTNDVSGDGIAKLAERAVAMARVAPDDKYVGPCRSRRCWRANFPSSICSIPHVPSTAELERRAVRGRSRGACGQGRDANPAAPRPRPASAAWCW